jgi:hypothetical protein
VDTAHSATPSTALLSITHAGVQGNHNSAAPAVSGDGRYVAFVSSSQTLAINKTTTVDEIFLRDNETGILTRVTVTTTGADPNGASSSPSISADGRFIVFESSATNLVNGHGVGAYLYDAQDGHITYLVDGQSPVISRDGRFIAFTSTLSTLVPNDTNGKTDVFLIDRGSGQIERESVSTGGIQADNTSGATGLAISATGRYVAFASSATTLVAGDTNTRDDVFVRDRQTQTTIRASIASDGTQGNQASSGGSISGDGGRVVFESRASNLVLNDGNAAVDVFVHDTQNSQTSLVSVSSAGTQATIQSGNGVITPSGQFVTFDSADGTLVTGDTNAVTDVFVRDLTASTTSIASLSSTGGFGDGASDEAAISDDGRYVVFRSAATNLVPNDGNASTDVFMRGPLIDTPGVLAMTVQPAGASAGANFAVQPVVEVRNLDGTVKWDYNGPVTLAIKAGTGRAAAVLAGTTTVDAIGGVATFSGLSINLAGTGYVLSASSGTLTGTDSLPFNVAQTPTHLAFSVQPSGASAGLPFGTQPAVQVLDTENNVVTGFSGSVSLTIKAGTGRAGAILSGSATVNAVNGAASFAGLAIDLAGSSYVLSAASGLLAGADSTAFTVAQTPTKLVFSVQPAGASAGLAFTTQPVVQVLDAENNLVTAFTGQVTLSIKAGTGRAGAVLSGTTTFNAVAGVAGFAGLSIDKANTGYVLTASSGTLAAADSTAFTVLQTPTKLVFITQPAGAAAGLAFAAQPQIAVHDAEDNLVASYSGTATIAIKPGTGRTGAVLSGTLSVPITGGTALFSGLSIDLAGPGYVLSAGSNGLTAGETAPFAVAQTPTKVAFSIQPAGASAGLAFTTQPAVQVLDSENNVVTAFTGAVTIAIKPGTGRAGATLAGTGTVNAVAGVASYANLSIDLAGPGYILTATSGTLASADSVPFAVAQTPTKLAFTVQPAGASAGLSFTTQPVVRVLDAENNLVTGFAGAVGLAIKPGTGRVGAVLSGTVSVNATGGIATFTNLSINLAGGGYVLTGTSGSLTPADTTAFAVAQTATKLAFAVQPGGASAGIAFSTQPTVQALDAENNVVTAYTGAIGISIKSGTGRTGAILSGTTSLSAVAGVAAFSNLSVNLAGSGYVLTATSGSLSPADSASFAVAQTPTKLAIALQPAGAGAGLIFTTQPLVVVKDAEDNLVAGYSGAITMAIKAGTGRVGAVLSGTTTVTALNGVGTFTNLSLNLAGPGYVLTSTAANLASADTAAFTVAQTPTKLAFSQQPSGALPGVPFTSQPVVQVLDAENNVVSPYSGTVLVSLKAGTGSPGATLSGAATVSALSGVASFSGLSIDRAGSGYVLTAGSGTLPGVDSQAFAVTQPPFTVGDVAKALVWAGGLARPTGADVANYDVEKAGASNGIIDIGDALAIARKVRGLDPNP